MIDLFVLEGRTSGSAGILPDYFSLGDNASQPEGAEASSSASVTFWNGELTGSAGIIAWTIHEKTGGTIFPILTQEKYPASYSAAISAGLKEKAVNSRPALSSHVDDMAQYNEQFGLHWQDLTGHET